jgi:hypothetical protein
MRDTALVLAACAFPIHTWAIVRLLYEVPSWLIRLSVWELVGAVAYTLAFALLETALVFLIFIFLALILPAKLLRDRFVAQCTMMVLLSSVWAVLAHLGLAALWSDSRLFLAWLILLLGSLAISYLLIHWNRKLERAISSLVGRLVPLSYLYIGLDILSVFIIVLRNVSGGGA